MLPLIAKMMYIQLHFISLPIPQHDNNDDNGHGDGSKAFLSPHKLHITHAYYLINRCLFMRTSLSNFFLPRILP